MSGDPCPGTGGVIDRAAPADFFMKKLAGAAQNGWLADRWRCNVRAPSPTAVRAEPCVACQRVVGREMIAEAPAAAVATATSCPTKAARTAYTRASREVLSPLPHALPQRGDRLFHRRNGARLGRRSAPRHAHRRPLRARGGHRRRRHGRRLPRARHQPGSRRRHQDPALRAGAIGEGARAVQARGAQCPAPQPPEHHRGARGRRDLGRLLVHGDGAARGPLPRRDRRARRDGPRARHADHDPGGPRHRPRARPRHRPPRPQARQHLHPAQGRRHRHGQAARLRDLAIQDRRAADQQGRRLRHARVHGSRADQRSRDRRLLRSVRARDRLLRDGRRQGALQRQGPGGALRQAPRGASAGSVALQLAHPPRALGPHPRAAGERSGEAAGRRAPRAPDAARSGERARAARADPCGARSAEHPHRAAVAARAARRRPVAAAGAGAHPAGGDGLRRAAAAGRGPLDGGGAAGDRAGGAHAAGERGHAARPRGGRRQEPRDPAAARLRGGRARRRCLSRPRRGARVAHGDRDHPRPLRRAGAAIRRGAQGDHLLGRTRRVPGAARRSGRRLPRRGRRARHLEGGAGRGRRGGEAGRKRTSAPAWISSSSSASSATRSPSARTRRRAPRSQHEEQIAAQGRQIAELDDRLVDGDRAASAPHCAATPGSTVFSASWKARASAPRACSADSKPERSRFARARSFGGLQLPPSSS